LNSKGFERWSSAAILSRDLIAVDELLKELSLICRINEEHSLLLALRQEYTHRVVD
jgi:hypothetical protein